MTLAIITPTLGRPSLARLLEESGKQLGPQDEHFVVLDSLNGNAEVAREIVAQRRVLYLEHGDPRSKSGAAQRDLAMTWAGSTHLWFVDDDDLIEPGAVEEIKRACEEHPQRPHFFPMERTGIWFDHVNWEQGRMGGSQIIWPNRRDKLPKWMPDEGVSGHGRDMEFTRRLLDFYPDGPVEHSYFILSSPVGHIEGRR